MMKVNLQKVKKILNILCYWILPLGLLAISFIAPASEVFRLLGKAAMLLLVGILFVRPLADITGWRFLKIILGFRRQLGIAIFWLAFYHAAGFIYVQDLTQAVLYFDLGYHLFYGTVAMIGMTILAATSNDRSVRYLKRHWKKVQFITYPIFFLVLIHASMAEGEFKELIVFGSIYVFLKIAAWQLVKRRNAKLTKAKK